MLFACHGEGIASGIAATVNTVTGLGNTFAVDIPLEEDTDTVYERLKACIEQADNGKGVVVLYDMSPSSVARVKQALSRFTLQEAQQAAATAKNLATQQDVFDFLASCGK